LSEACCGGASISSSQKFPPAVLDQGPQTGKAIICDLCGLLLEIEAVGHGSQDQIGAAQSKRQIRVDQMVGRKRLEQADVVGPAGDIGQLMGMLQYEELDQKFDVDDAAAALLDIESSLRNRILGLTQFFAHAGHRCFQPAGIPGLGQGFDADLFETFDIFKHLMYATKSIEIILFILIYPTN
jgi:hypothetical protein